MTGAVHPLSPRERVLALAVIVVVPLDVVACGWMAVRRHAIPIVYAAPALDALLLGGGVLYLVGRRAGGLRGIGLSPRRAARLLALALAVAGVATRLLGLTPTRQLFGAAAVAELAIVAAVALGLGRGLGGVLPPRALGILRNELAIGSAAWRALTRRPIAVDDQLHTVTRASRWPSLVTALIVISAFEMTALHTLLHASSARTHLILAALHLYGIVWLLGDLRLLREGGVRVSDEEVVVRLGVRAAAQLPRAAIASAQRIEGGERRAPGLVRLTPVDAPNVELVLDRPHELELALGRRRQAVRVQLYVDDPERLLALLG